MTNRRQIRCVFKPLVERHPDVFLVDPRNLCVGPIHHVVRRIIIDNTSMPDCAGLRWSAQEMFLPNRFLPNRLPAYDGTHYRFTYRRDPPGADEMFGTCWQWSDPTMVPHLVSMLENEALPFLRTLDSLETYAEHYEARGKSFIRHPTDRMLLAIALGDLDKARAICLEQLPNYRGKIRGFGCLYDSLRTSVLTVADPLMAGDRAALAAILHGWEEANVRGTVLEPHWEPTPFPLETM